MVELTSMKCTVAEAVATLKSLWFCDENTGRTQLTSDADGDNTLVGRRGEVQPLCAYLHEYDVGSNPLWEIVRWMSTGRTGCCGDVPKVDGYHMSLSEHRMRQLYDMGIARTTLCKTYSFSIISPTDIAWISKLTGSQGIVEINAGRGYWAWQL